MKSLPRSLTLVLATLQLQASFATFASFDSLYIDGHCDAAVNGVWERSTSENEQNVTFQRNDLLLYRRDDGDDSAWVLVAPIGVLGQSLDIFEPPTPSSTRSSEWQIWCSASDASNAMNGTLWMTRFSQEIYDLSTNLCGERLPFSRISRHLYFAGAGNATGPGHFLFFNCSRSSWYITTSSLGLLESATCDPSYPSHSWAICDGSMINLTLHQEFYPVTGCGSEFFPEGRSASGAPFYRADSSDRSLYFDPDCALGSQWILSGGSCEGETSETSGAATGPPLGDADGCDFSAKDNIQLALDVYKLWTLQGFSEALSEKQQLCDVAPTAFGAPGEFQPDLEYLKVMAGPETLIRRMLIYSRNPDDLEDVAKELDLTFVVSQGWPFAFIFIWLPLALSLLCSAIPCCHCCRCFARERRTKYQVKVLLFISLTLVLIGIATCIGIASAGLQTLEEGKLMSHCASSQLMSTTLDGDGVDFVGLRPLLQRIDAVLQGQEKEAFLSRTQRVVRSAQLATATLQLLSSTLDSLDVEVAAMWHRCGYCEELRPRLRNALEELEEYLAKSPVATQRALEGRDLHDRLSGAAATLSRLQQLALEALPFLYAENGLGRIWNETFGIVVGFILLLTILLAVTFIMAYGSMASFAQEPRETGITGQGEYLRRTSACSCCSWCFFSGLAVMMCGMAGCIVVAYSQLGGFCLELHDLAQADLFRTTGLSPMADIEVLDVLGIMQVTSSCLPKEGSPGATDVFALLQASPSGPSVRDVLSDFTGRTPTALPEISELRSYVRDTPVDALLLPSDDAESNPRYRAMLTDLRTRIGFSSSVACADWTMPGQQVIPGMETFFESFRSMGAASGSCSGSNQSLLCSEVVTTSGQACRAAQRFMKTKNLLRKKRFRCDLFVDASEVPCDVKDMAKANGEWQVPCVPQTVHRTCDLDEFRTYLMDFDVRLGNVFQMLGEEMDLTELTDLKILTAPIPGGCENFALFWQRFLNGLCFVSLPGLRTITMSFLVASGVALSGVILMYFVWRRAYDNFSRSQDLFKPATVAQGAAGSATPRQGTPGTAGAERTAGVTFCISDEDDVLEL